jgi:hydrophobic/amphiphilic exporter-1 (mainly G- bacteria), HAE1 family
MSYFSRLSLANRGLTALVAVIVTAFGLLLIPQIKQQLFPSLDFPGAFVSAAYPGAAPEVVATQVTEPIEAALAGTPGLKRITSTSTEGVATIQVEFDFGTDLDDATTTMQTSLNQISSTLPDEVNPQVFAFRTDNFPVVILGASGGGGDESDLADRIRADVLPAIQAIDGVREASLTGARDRQVVITPNPVRLAAAGLGVTDLTTMLRVNGLAVPAGAVPDNDKSLTVSVGTPLTTVDQIRDLWLRPASAAPGTAQPVQLSSVATVSERLAPPTSITRTNGAPSLGILVLATPDGNAVGISHEIRDMLPELRQSLGDGAQLSAVFDQAPYVEKSIEGLTTEGLLGLLMAVLVILVFLLSIRSTIVTAVSIPLSVVIALIALKVFDYSLNVLTLGALTIAIGRVVDDSIVVLENIKRHLGYGEDKHRAILTAVKEVAGAVTASTLTTVAVFSPIALVGGIVGQLFSSFAVTITVALLASLAVSLTVIPVLAYWFLRPATGADEETVRAQAEERERRGPLQRTYVPVLRFTTRRRWLTVTGALVLFVLTVGSAGLLKTNFFDQSGETTLTVTQTLPVGTSLATTDEAAQEVEEILGRTDGIALHQVTVGSGGAFGFGGGGTNVATHSITLDDDAKALDMQARLRDALAGLDAGEIKVDAGSGGGGFSASAIQVIVQADDEDTLAAAAEQVRQAVSGVRDVTDVTSDLTTSAPRVQVTVDRQRATALGLTEAQVGQAVAAAFRGAPLGEYTLDGHRQQVLLTLGLPAPGSVDQLKKLPVAPGPIMLDQVATVSTVDGPTQVTRIDGQRSVTVSGTATGSNLGQTTQDLNTALTALVLPEGATYTVAGASADQADAFGNLTLALLAAIAIVFLIMAATFRSLVQPLILLVSVPFAATGAILALLVTNTALGVPALIGMLMLVGIVVTNAIVLLDLINQYRQQGASVQDAVIEGGRRRLRPVLMTAVATMFALLPMALGVTGQGGFISQPLAVVVIGGLLTSTLLTLVLVPTLYTIVEGRKERRAARRASRTSAEADGSNSAAGSDPSAGSDSSAGSDPSAGSDSPADVPLPAR